MDEKIQYLTRYARVILVSLSLSLFIADDDIADQRRCFIIFKIFEKIVVSFKLREAENVRDAVLFPVFAVKLKYSVIVNYRDAYLWVIFKALSIDLASEFGPESLFRSLLHEFPHLRRQPVEFIIEYYLHISPVADFVSLGSACSHLVLVVVRIVSPDYALYQFVPYNVYFGKCIESYAFNSAEHLSGLFQA